MKSSAGETRIGFLSNDEKNARCFDQYSRNVYNKKTSAFICGSLKI